MERRSDLQLGVEVHAKRYWSGRHLAVLMTLVGLLATLGGCQRVASGGAGMPSSAPTAVSSASAEPPRYRIPNWEGICATAQTTGIAVKKAQKDTDSRYQAGCRIDTGSDTQIASVTVTFEVSRIAAQTFQISKDNDWNKGFAFSGPARDKAVVQQVGSAKLGQDYDDGYYAYFPDVEAAGARHSSTTVVILRGNALVSFSAGGAEWHGAKPKTVKELSPIGPDFGKDVIDTMADEMLALLKREQ
jgi:hypothetical protein